MKRDPIEIIPYNAVWQEYFLQAKKDISQALGDSCLTIEHIGSTAVSGLAAKDRIDIQIGVQDISVEFCEAINLLLRAHGFQQASIRVDHLPPNEFDEQEWTKLYLSGVHPHWQFKANIHMRKVGAKNYNYALLFRDYLRNNGEAAIAYSKLKQILAKHTHHDRDAYCEIKDPVCDLIMINATEWIASIK